MFSFALRNVANSQKYPLVLAISLKTVTFMPSNAADAAKSL